MRIEPPKQLLGVLGAQVDLVVGAV